VERVKEGLKEGEWDEDTELEAVILKRVDAPAKLL